MDVKAREVIEYDSVEDLREVLLSHKGQPLLPIGQGSNLLFTKDYEGTILISRMQRARALKETQEAVWIEAQSGLVMDEFIEQVVDMGLYGLENLSYIPGTVGASAVQNVGAYGVEAKDVIEEVHTLEVATAEERVFTNKECRFGYRDSYFKNEGRGRYIVTSVVYKLIKEGELKLDYGNLRASLAGLEHPTLQDVRQAVINVRRTKLPEVSEMGSAGSFFKNPVIDSAHFEALIKQYPEMPHYAIGDRQQATGDREYKIPAAWLIEQCGWKGKEWGGAQCYDKQPLVLVNENNATSQDIVELAAAICESIREKFGISVSPEVNYV